MSMVSNDRGWDYFAEALGWYPTGYGLTGAQTFGVVQSLRKALRDGRITPDDLGVPTLPDEPLWSIFDEVRAERARAHAKHRDTSMEAFAPDDLARQEVGEVAKEFNEARHDGRPVDLAKLRKGLIQVAAMAAAWADACGSNE